VIWYGYPHQTKDSIIDTINKKLEELKPDRIALLQLRSRAMGSKKWTTWDM